MTRPPGYVDTQYLDVIKDRIQHDKQRSYEEMHLAKGSSVIEVGCGPATDTLPLARIVGSAGRVVGVDIDPEMVAEANERARANGLQDTVTHLVSDAAALPFDDDAFDAARSERLFQHLPNAAAVVGEMVRVTRPDGRIVVIDMDWGTVSIDSPEVDIERRLMRFKAERLHTNGYAGRQLNRLFREAGLIDVRVEPRPIYSDDLDFLRYALAFDVLENRVLEEEVASPEEVARWRAGLDASAARRTFFASGLMMIASGTKRPHA